MVESNNKGAERYNFTEYQHAKQVVNELPAILIIIDKLIPVLQEKSQYTGVFSLLQAAYDSKILLEMQYSFYKKIYDDKGKVDE